MCSCSHCAAIFDIVSTSSSINPLCHMSLKYTVVLSEEQLSCSKSTGPNTSTILSCPPMKVIKGSLKSLKCGLTLSIPSMQFLIVPGTNPPENLCLSFLRMARTSQRLARSTPASKGKGMHVLGSRLPKYLTISLRQQWSCWLCPKAGVTYTAPEYFCGWLSTIWVVMVAPQLDPTRNILVQGPYSRFKWSTKAYACSTELSRSGRQPRVSPPDCPKLSWSQAQKFMPGLALVSWSPKYPAVPPWLLSPCTNTPTAVGVGLCQMEWQWIF